jgi:eukaryotic-like serine/threonine-protein kinase
MADPTQPLTEDTPTRRGIGPAHETAPPRAPRMPLPPSRYEVRDQIGEGGMGEVLAAYDDQIGREVAIKRIRASQPPPETLKRFVREARIQGRLDHPAIVPVHELATDDAGLPYFTMKRISGQTLAKRAASGAPLHELLRAFVDVCRAIEFAHSRGVVHRDVKPANVMLGDFGEVYVLDWGIARVLDEPELAPDHTPALDSCDDTKTGALMGTLGYMAPELYRGVLATPASDVYSLGAILFELLAGEPLHGKHPSAALAAVVEGIREFPSQRRPERSVPPELDQVCFAALSPNADERPTARQLGERVQSYLDGDRDLDHRRKLAAEQLEAAYDALSSSASDRNIIALRRASRALALDPASADAATLVSSLLIASPDPLPPALVARLATQDRRNHRDRSRRAIAAYLALAVLLPTLFLLDVQNWQWLAAVVVTIAVAIGGSLFHLLRGRPSIPVVALTNLAVVVVFSRIASPFVLTPVLVTCALVAITTIPWFTQRTWAVLAWTFTAVLLPFALEWLDVLSRTWTITDAGMVITGDVFAARGRTDEIVLVIANLVCTTIGGLLALGLSRRQQSAQRQLYIQAWHLGYLVPRAETHADVTR